MSGECQTKNKKPYSAEDDDKPIVALDEGLLQTIIEHNISPLQSVFLFLLIVYFLLSSNFKR